MERLAEIYNNYCLKCSDGSYTSGDDYDWIPGKILRCFYDKDFRQDIVFCYKDIQTFISLYTMDISV